MSYNRRYIVGLQFEFFAVNTPSGLIASNNIRCKLTNNHHRLERHMAMHKGIASSYLQSVYGLRVRLIIHVYVSIKAVDADSFNSWTRLSKVKIISSAQPSRRMTHMFYTDPQSPTYSH